MKTGNKKKQELCLQSKEQYLLLSRSVDHQYFSIEVFDSFNEVVKKWEYGSRISPIVSLAGKKSFTFSGQKKCWCIFFGPIYPGNIVLDESLVLYTTFGLFNLLAFCFTESQRQKVKDIAKDNNVSWEEWEIEKSKIYRKQYSGCTEEVFKKLSFKECFNSPKRELTAVSQEYRTLLKSAIWSSSFFHAEATIEYIEFNRTFQKIIGQRNFNTIQKQGLLVITNAILSRHFSQTYTGVSPITQNACPFTTHSLLGIGTASLALTKLRSFLMNALEDACIVDRLKSLKDVKAESRPLRRVSPTKDKFWKQDFLCDLGKSNNEDGTNQSFRALVCYSGRDGFRNTNLSISTPLELVASCNTISWTFLTLTHEISHFLIARVLGALLFNKVEKGEELKVGLADICLIENGTQAPLNLLEQICAFLVRAIVRLEKNKDKLSISGVQGLLQKHYGEANEILTHCFDFLFFYNQEAQPYIHSVWASWDAIPNIESRIPKYIIRTLCALYTMNITKNNGKEITIDQFIEMLEKVMKSHPKAQYAPEALIKVKRDRAFYCLQLKDCQSLVQFAKSFLYSKKFGNIMRLEPLLSAGGSRKQIKVGRFSPEKLCNPLHFVREFAVNQKSDQVRSLWMLQNIAFGEIN